MEENEKRDINMVAMEVIMNAGDGRDKIDEALAAMAEGIWTKWTSCWKRQKL